MKFNEYCKFDKLIEIPFKNTNFFKEFIFSFTSFPVIKAN